MLSSLLISQRKARIMGHISWYTWAMKPRNEGMGHGKEKGASTGDVHERVRNREEMPEYLANLRWPDEFVCPKCGCRHACPLSNDRYRCAECRRQTSVTAGTVLHRTHMPLTQWSLAFYICQSGQAGHLRRCADVDAGSEL